MPPWARSYYPLEMILNSIADPVFVKNRDHEWIYLNDAYYRFMGESREEMLGKSDYDLFPAGEASVFWEKDEEVFASGKSNENEELITDLDGRTHTILTKKSLYITPDGNPLLIGIIRDITDRKKAEEQVRESEELYRNLADNLPEYVVVHRDREILYINKTAITFIGLSEKQILGRSVLDFIAPEDRQLFLDEISHNIGEGGDSYQIHVIGADNRRRIGLVRRQVIYYRGEPAVLAAVTDITQLVDTKRSLREANTKLNILSSITRHDIRNQVSVAYLKLDQIRAKGIPAGLVGSLDHLDASLHAISDLLDFTEMYQDIGVKTPNWQNITRSITDGISPFEGSDIRVQMDIPDIEIYADPLLPRVFYNLVDDSIRHGGSVSGITISAEEKDGSLIILYQDDGHGIPEEEKEGIFDRKFYHNTGLGLYLSRDILAITNISIREAGTFGKGALFVITVPAGAFRISSSPPISEENRWTDL